MDLNKVWTDAGVEIKKKTGWFVVGSSSTLNRNPVTVLRVAYVIQIINELPGKCIYYRDLSDYQWNNISCLKQTFQK